MHLFIYMSMYYFLGILNSRAADNLPDIIPLNRIFSEETYSHEVASKLLELLQFPRTLIYLLLGNMYLILFVACSGAALFANRIWFYAPCLIDILDQIPTMRFILTAMRKNLFTITFTVLLMILILYFFAVFCYLFFGNQYSLNGHMDCKDMGSCFQVHLDYGFYNNIPDWSLTNYAIRPTVYGLNEGMFFLL